MINKIKLIISEAFEEDFSNNNADENLLFKDYDGWDSLTAMILIDSINTEFGIEIPIDNISEMSINSVQQLLSNANNK